MCSDKIYEFGSYEPVGCLCGGSDHEPVEIHAFQETHEDEELRGECEHPVAIQLVGRRLRDGFRKKNLRGCCECGDIIDEEDYHPVTYTGGPCSNCGNNVTHLYTRGRTKPPKKLCAHCIDLERQRSGRMTEGRHNQGGEPRNQPTPTTMHGKMEPCRWCGQPAAPKYAWGLDTFTFCGWAHAGLWMDQQMGPDPLDQEDLELAEGEAYVRRSLGITDG